MKLLRVAALTVLVVLVTAARASAITADALPPPNGQAIQPGCPVEMTVFGTIPDEAGTNWVGLFVESAKAFYLAVRTPQGSPVDEKDPTVCHPGNDILEPQQTDCGPVTKVSMVAVFKINSDQEVDCNEKEPPIVCVWRLSQPFALFADISGDNFARVVGWAVDHRELLEAAKIIDSLREIIVQPIERPKPEPDPKPLKRNSILIS